MGDIEVVEAAGTTAELEVAGIWARATGRRDGQEPRDVAETLTGIRRRLTTDGSTLLVARRHGVAIGFAIAEPEGVTLEVRYLAVDVDAWGAGVGRRLLDAADDLARAAACTTLKLWVIAENQRAIAVYERAGWARADEVQTEPGSRAELRMVRTL